MKTNIDFKGQAWVRPPAKCWVKGFANEVRFFINKLTRKISFY